MRKTGIASKFSSCQALTEEMFRESEKNAQLWWWKLFRSFHSAAVLLWGFTISRFVVLPWWRRRENAHSVEAKSQFHMQSSTLSGPGRVMSSGTLFFVPFAFYGPTLELFVFMLNFVPSSLSPRCVWECCGAEVETETELYVKIFIHFCGNFHLSKCNLWLKSREKSPRSEIWVALRFWRIDFGWCSVIVLLTIFIMPRKLRTIFIQCRRRRENVSYSRANDDDSVSREPKFDHRLNRLELSSESCVCFRRRLNQSKS